MTPDALRFSLYFLKLCPRPLTLAVNFAIVGTAQIHRGKKWRTSPWRTHPKTRENRSSPSPTCSVYSGCCWSGVTDIADGFIARRFNMVSDLGKVLDPVADKLTQTAALVCLLTRFQAVWWLLGTLVFKETVMAVMGILIIRRTRAVYSAAWHGKLATCVLYAVIFAHIVWYNIPPSVSTLLAAAGIACILLSLILYTTANLRRLKEADK